MLKSTILSCILAMLFAAGPSFCGEKEQQKSSNEEKPMLILLL